MASSRYRLRSIMMIVAAALACAACQAAPGMPSEDHDITAADMRARIKFLSSDMLRGRATPSPGLERAARYIESEFRRVGLESVRERYTQRYRLVRAEMGDGWALVLEGGGRRVALRHEVDFWGLPWAAGTIQGPVRFVGSRPPSPGRAATDETEIWVVRLRGRGVTVRRWLDAAHEAGAAGLIFMVPDDMDALLRTWYREGELVFDVGDLEPSLPAVLVTDSAFATVLDDLGLTSQPAVLGAPDSRVTARLTADLRAETRMAPNVMGVLPGSDPQRRDEYVVVSAHMDHLGVGAPIEGDSIYNGADDNASGTAAVIEIAEALAALDERPARSVLFLTVSGEEIGLLGSKWFVNNPPVPLEDIVADVNLDMIGRNWEDTIAIVGKEHSTLGSLADSVAVAHPELGMSVVGDRWPAERLFFRSDHYSFARRGVPAIFVFAGLHEDYHRPSDEWAKVKMGKAARVARLVLEVVRAVADAEDTPEWDSRVRESIVEEPR